MSKILALVCVAAGVIGVSTASAQAAEPVNTLPKVAHINQVVVVERHRHHYHHGYYRHHRRYYYRHHRRYYY